MQPGVIQRIRQSLLEKRQNVSVWLETAPESEKECCLGEAPEAPVEAHLQVVNAALEKAEDETLGVCQVCHGQIEPGVLEIDYTASICLDCLSAPEKRRLESELEFSTQVQRALLPQEDPSIPGLEVAAFSRPAQYIGGDYFDFFRFRDGSQGLVIADVMGHGVSASLLMSSLQTALQTLAPDYDAAPELMRRINRFYLHNIKLTTFVTIFLGQFDPERRRLAYCNAGHNPPLLLRQAGGLPAWLGPTAAAVGLVEDYRVRAETVSLEPGDIVVLYTDGVTEAVNPSSEQLGRERLADLVAAHAQEPARELLASLRQGLSDFLDGESLADDVTIVVCKVPG